MDFSSKRLSTAETKQTDLVGYLSSLGFESAKLSEERYWYHPLLHPEKMPSFVVNRNRNIFYDFGIGKGASLIDVGTMFHQSSVPEFLQLLSGENPGFEFAVRPPAKTATQQEENKIRITRVLPLSSPSLLRYLETHGIPVELAVRYCNEVRFENGGKNYYGIGSRNNSGGYEIRNPYFKGSSAPKGITTFPSGGQHLAVFEGFMDFLSYLVLTPEHSHLNTDYLILNSLSFFEKSMPILRGYKSCQLYLDRNAAGQKATRQALALGRCIHDESYRNRGSEDLNDFLLTGNRLRARRRHKGMRRADPDFSNSPSCH